MKRDRGEIITGGCPNGWSVGPWDPDTMDLSWEDRANCLGNVRPMIQIEHGQRIVTEGSSDLHVLDGWSESWERDAAEFFAGWETAS